MSLEPRDIIKTKEEFFWATIVWKVMPTTNMDSPRFNNIKKKLEKECRQYIALSLAEALKQPTKDIYHGSSVELLEEIVSKAKTIDEDFRSGAGSTENVEQGDSGKPKRGCYIATACYRSYTHPDVCTFRNYRDNVLMTSIIGRLFVSFYYSVSPPIARRIGNLRWLATGIRKLFLEPMAARIRKKYK